MGHRTMTPPPMPGVAQARLPMSEAKNAAERGAEAWNRSQLEDAIRSVEFFIEKAKAALAAQDRPTAQGAVDIESKGKHA